MHDILKFAENHMKFLVLILIDYVGYAFSKVHFHTLKLRF